MLLFIASIPGPFCRLRLTNVRIACAVVVRRTTSQSFRHPSVSSLNISSINKDASKDMQGLVSAKQVEEEGVFHNVVNKNALREKQFEETWLDPNMNQYGLSQHGSGRNLTPGLICGKDSASGLEMDGFRVWPFCVCTVCVFCFHRGSGSVVQVGSCG